MKKIQSMVLLLSLIFILGGCANQGNYHTINLPASFAEEGKTQADYDLLAKENGWEAITLNEDGSLTYVMTKKQHDELMKETKETIDTNLVDMIGSEQYPNIVDIEVNDTYTEFIVTTKSEHLNFFESFSTVGFYMLSGMYNALNGTPIDNCRVVYINEASGEVIEEINSNDTQG